MNTLKSLVPLLVIVSLFTGCGGGAGDSTGFNNSSTASVPNGNSNPPKSSSLSSVSSSLQIQSSNSSLSTSSQDSSNVLSSEATSSASSSSKSSSISSQSSSTQVIIGNSSSSKAPVLTAIAGFKTNSVGVDFVTLSWDKVDTALYEQVKIYRDGYYVQAIKSNVISFTDYNVSPSKTYQYIIVGVDKFGAVSPQSFADATTLSSGLPSSSSSSLSSKSSSSLNQSVSSSSSTSSKASSVSSASAISISSSQSSSKLSSNSSSVSSSSSSVVASSSSASVISSSSKSSSSIDSTPPTMPLISLKQTVSTSVVISWSGSTDNVGVTQYNLYKNQIPIATLTANDSSYTDTNILPNKMYTYGISAGDAANNWSGIRTDIITTMAASSSSLSSSSISSSASSKSSLSSISSSSPSSSSSSSSIASSASSSKSSSSAASSSSSSLANSNTAYLKWAPPVQRENGDALDITELGGYELRYRLLSDNTYTYVTINNAFTTEYFYNASPLNMVFQIAAFDKNNLYSNFVDLIPK